MGRPAEASQYRQTSSYADVLGFLDSLRQLGAPVSLGTVAVSQAGRPVRYVVASRPLVAGPGEAAGSRKAVVYLQANIHAGEVEGKEAAQMLLRDLTLGPLAPLLDSLVLLVVPVYNVDGNAPAARRAGGISAGAASEDGVVTWNLLDGELDAGRPYPILRSRRAVAAAATDGRSHAPSR